ncbi:MAG: cytosine permease [Rhodoluna sp.]|nr:cytosine permease [Rhodoluna sp.]MBP6186786.1 cytosine permease [Rhodoluna sp.]
MTNPFDPPKKLAMGDAELAAALELAGQSENGALDAMALLEEQSKLRAEDANAYVAWVRSMEADGSAEAKAALNHARRASSGLSIDPVEAVPVSETTEDSWKALVPDWDERQEQIAEAKEKAVADAIAQATEQAEREIESAVAEAVAAAEFEAELRREEAVAAAKAEAERLEAERLEQERLRAEELAEQQRLEELERQLAEAELAEAERIEAQRIEAEQLELESLRAEELAEQQRLEELEHERVVAERIEAERIEAERQEIMRLEVENAERAAAEALELAELEALERAEAAENLRLAVEQAQVEEVAAEPITVDDFPQPVRASDFATGSFDIVESVEQAATEEFDEDNFEVLLTDGELGFARDPKSVAKDHAVSTIERRAKPISQLFVWSSLSLGVAPILLAYLSLAFELTALDRIFSFAVAFGLSALIFTVVAIGGKRSGLSTLFLSRAAFGVTANMVPAIAQVFSKLAIGSALMVSALALFNGNIVGLPKFNETAASFGSIDVSWSAVIAIVLLILASVVALLGGKVLHWAQLSVAGVGALTVLLFVGFSAGGIQVQADEFTFSGNALPMVSLIVLIVATFAALWVNSVADFTRKIAMAESGKMVALYVSLAAGVLPFLISTFSVLLSASLSANLRLAAMNNPFGAIFAIVPSWLASLVLVSAALTFMAWAASWLYSSSVGLAAVSIKLRRYISQPIVLVLTLVSVVAMLQLSASPSPGLLTAFIVVAAVLVLSWAGIFVSDIALRRIAYHEVSLTRDYGFYRAANPSNIVGFILSVALGLGFVSSTASEFAWLGYIAKPIGASDWANTNIGILIALGFASLFPLLFGRNRIKAQEIEVLKIEARKKDLDGVSFGEAI